MHPPRRPLSPSNVRHQVFSTDPRWEAQRTCADSSRDLCFRADRHTSSSNRRWKSSKSPRFEFEKTLVDIEKTPFQLVGPRFDLEKTRGVFVQPRFLFVSSPVRFNMWRDVESAPHFDRAWPLFLLEGSHFELEWGRFVSATWAQRPRRGEGTAPQGRRRLQMHNIRARTDTFRARIGEAARARIVRTRRGSRRAEGKERSGRWEMSALQRGVLPRATA